MLNNVICVLSSLAVMLSLLPMQPLKAQDNSRPWAPAAFPISYWCGPPDAFTTIDRYREIKAAGFTHVMPPCGGAATVDRNRTILGLCAAVGLKAFISDARMPLRITGEADAKARLEAIVRDYKGYAALEGYFLADEPGAGAFPGLAEVVAYLRRIDPTHYTYINLFPNYANEQQLGTRTYEEHVRRFYQQVRPFVLSFDHYHFLTSGDRPGFFDNLALMRKLSLEYGVAFWNIVLAVQHGPYRNLTAGEISYEAMQTLVYGGKGLLWFTYWQPDDASFNWSHAMVNLNGTHDPHYEMVQRVNHEVGALGSQLLHATSRAVFQTGALAPGATAAPRDAPITASGPAHLTIGLFDAPQSKHLVLVTNADYRQPADARLHIAASRRQLRRFDPLTGRWRPVLDAISGPHGSASITLGLPPGGAALLRW